MRLQELFEQTKLFVDDTSVVPEEAKQAAIEGDFATFEHIVHPIVNSTGSVHLLYFKVRKEAGIDDEAAAA